MPTVSLGLASLRASTTFTSEVKDGTDVCRTTWSKSFAWATTSARLVLWGGASISFEFSTRAAGWASQVGNQKDLISRFA